MPFISDENETKVVQEAGGGNFLKMADGKNTLRILSHMYLVRSHYLQSKKVSVICKGKECVFCESGTPARMESFYWVDLNGATGLLRIPVSALITMRDIESMTGEDKRQSEWLILKKGSGMETRYTAVKGSSITPPDNKDLKEIEAKMGKILVGYEKKLEDNYDANLFTEAALPDDEPGQSEQSDPD